VRLQLIHDLLARPLDIGLSGDHGRPIGVNR
jgi:hypothetical protein